MTWNIVTAAFSGQKFKRGQRFLDKIAKPLGIRHFKFGDDDLFKSQFYKDHEDFFLNSPLAGKDNKFGAFVWKPQFILDAMDQLEEGDKIFYLDTLDVFHPDIFKFVDQTMGDDPCLLAMGNSINGQYTKRDCFVFMDCDEEDYWNVNQLEAGFSFWRVCDEAKEILKEWQKWLFDERVNGKLTDFSGKPQLDGFKDVRRDQSILTNLAVRDGLSVVGQELRSLIEGNADYWWERYANKQVQPYRPIDSFMIQLKDEVDYMKPHIVDSIILTVHNQEGIIKDVLKGIEDNTTGEYELIIVFDGCTDSSEQITKDYILSSSLEERVIYKNAPNVFETKANNIGLREAVGDYVIIIQDDMIIKEKGWNHRMRKPFEEFNDVFAVTARTAHNYKKGSATHLETEDLDNCWCDILESCDGANQNNTPRDVFAVRSTVNRGPLMINLEDLREMDYFDETFEPQDMDDHDLMFRMHKKLGKVCGCYWIDFDSEPEWGGTRKETGQPAPWLLKANHKNTKIFYERNSEEISKFRVVEDRKLP